MSADGIVRLMPGEARNGLPEFRPYVYRGRGYDIDAEPGEILAWLHEEMATRPVTPVVSREELERHSEELRSASERLEQATWETGMRGKKWRRTA